MKKFFICLLSALMLLSLCGVSAITLDTAEASESVETADAALAATITPGINLATGTAAPQTFEDMTALGSLFHSEHDWTNSIGAYDVADISGLTASGNTSSKAMRIEILGTGTSAWQGIHLNLPTTNGRRYYISADMYTDLYTKNASAVEIGNCFAVWGSSLIDTKNSLGINSKAGKWVTQRCDPEMSKENPVVFSLLYQITTTSHNAYVDNLSVVPYYQITYAGTTTTTEWYLFDEEGNIATTYAPKTDNLPADYTSDGKLYTCIGWSDYQGATEASAVVNLYNSDVTLYPVWQEVELLTADKTVLGDTGSARITATEDVTWSYDENNASVTVMGKDARYIEVYTAATDSTGEFTVTGTTADGESAEITIHVVKTTPVLRPGLNMLTGSVKPMDFENYDSIPGIFSLTNTTYIGSMNLEGIPVTSSGNTSNTALVLNRNSSFKGQAWQSVFRIASVIEAGRPYSVSAKMFSDLYVNGCTIPTNQNARIYWGWTGGGAGSAWVNFDNSFTNPAKNGQWYAYTNTNLTNEANKKVGNTIPVGFEFSANDFCTEKYYFDDLLVMPYYKITYKNPDGTDAATVYALYDASGNVLTNYTIDTTKVPGATGYALSQEAANVGQFVTSVPLNNQDIVIYTTDKEGIVFTDGENTTLVEITEGFTFPTPEELGFSGENFIKWTNGSSHIDAGEEVADPSVYAYTTFTAFYQDASKPAMGFAFEGDGLSEYGNNVDEQYKTTAREYMEADGRDYYHVNLLNTAGTYAVDAKFWFNASRFAPGKANIDGAEYSIFSYSAKVLNAANLTNSVVTPVEGVKVKIFYHGSAWSGLSESRKIGNTDYNNNPVGEYFNITCDMSDIAGAAWNTASIANLIVEPVRTNYSFDVYFDYIRVYRKGLTTVTYDTNAPEGATVVTNIAAETERGVGTDYKLTGLRPEVEGYTFLGWSLTADGTETVEAIDLTGDTTVYAVWKNDALLSAPEMLDECEIRGNGTTDNGIRFKATMMNSVKVNLDEFGFITTRETMLPKEDNIVDYTALTFDLFDITTGKKKYAYGVSYKKSAGIDVIHGAGDNGEIIYTAVLTGIPLTYKNEAMAVRSYAKFEVNGNTITVYGNIHSSSLYDAALEISKDTDAYETNKTYIDSILAE